MPSNKCHFEWESNSNCTLPKFPFDFAGQVPQNSRIRDIILYVHMWYLHSFVVPSFVRSTLHM